MNGRTPRPGLRVRFDSVAAAALLVLLGGTALAAYNIFGIPIQWAAQAVLAAFGIIWILLTRRLSIDGSTVIFGMFVVRFRQLHQPAASSRDAGRRDYAVCGFRAASIPFRSRVRSRLPADVVGEFARICTSHPARSGLAGNRGVDRGDLHPHRALVGSA